MATLCEPQPQPRRAAEEPHTRLLYAALAAADAARRDAEADNARLRAALSAARERIVQLAAAETRLALPACGCCAEMQQAPAPALRSVAPVLAMPPACTQASAAVVRVAVTQAALVGQGEAEDQENLAHTELRRRAHALGLGAGALFPKRSSGDVASVAPRGPARPQLSG
jgi:hypothetical protein